MHEDGDGDDTGEGIQLSYNDKILLLNALGALMRGRALAPADMKKLPQLHAKIHEQT